MVVDKPSDKEDEYFAKKEFERRKKIACEKRRFVAAVRHSRVGRADLAARGGCPPTDATTRGDERRTGPAACACHFFRMTSFSGAFA